MADLASFQARVYGVVQGVFFRAFVANNATRLGLTGYSSNLPDGSVEVYAEGERRKLQELLKLLDVGPPGARVDRVESNWSEYEGQFIKFKIR